jgi:hypothetical protein
MKTSGKRKKEKKNTESVTGSMPHCILERVSLRHICKEKLLIKQYPENIL